VLDVIVGMVRDSYAYSSICLTNFVRLYVAGEVRYSTNDSIQSKIVLTYFYKLAYNRRED
jgi:hypothetical protein